MNALQIGYFTVFTKLNIYRFYYVYLLTRRLEIASTQTKPTCLGYSEGLDDEIQSWLKLAAFVKRNRDIKLGGDN